MGAYFLHEYSFEAAALFNPSIVAHPDQTGAPEGGVRFVLSLRAVGEGHVSSLTFRSGSVARGRQREHRSDGAPRLDPEGEQAHARCRTARVIELGFSPEQDISERVIFPVTASQSNGIEDARFVEFDDGAAKRITRPIPPIAARPSARS